MKSKIFILILCLLSLSFTQNNFFTYGILGGLNIPELKGGNNEISRGYTSRLGEAFGITSSYYLHFNLALQADLLYSSEGGKRNGLQAYSNPLYNPQATGPISSLKYLYANFNNESILNYIEIPLMIKYFILNNFYINIGPYVNFLLNAQQKTDGLSLIYIDKNKTMVISPLEQSFNALIDVTNSIKRINCGLTGGIGIILPIDFGNVFLDIRGSYGLIPIQKNKSDGSSYNGCLLIAVGYEM